MSYASGPVTGDNVQSHLSLILALTMSWTTRATFDEISYCSDSTPRQEDMIPSWIPLLWWDDMHIVDRDGRANIYKSYICYVMIITTHFMCLILC